MDYILRSLMTPKINEIFILTSKHRKEIEEHLQNYRLTATVIQADKCFSFGDCLREINSRRVLKEDFLLIKGSCVPKLNLNAIFDSFEAIKTANRDVIMLKVFTSGSTLSEVRREGDNPLVVLDKDNTILYFENLKSNTYWLRGKVL